MDQVRTTLSKQDPGQQGVGTEGQLAIVKEARREVESESR